MEVNRYSITAVMMAAVRAYHYAGPEPRIFEDMFARRLLSPAECESFERTAVRWLKHLDPTLSASCSDRTATLYHSLRVGPGAGGLVRARYIEEALFKALAHEVHQYVIIGAGLDTFAFRQPEIGNRLRVIEIDHPATQAFKRDRLAQAGLIPPSHLFFAAADLERESVAVALGRTPYDRTTPAFFAWPGVTMYLTRKAIFETLKSIASVADVGSILVFDYLEPAAFAPDAPVRIRFALQRARRLGEPMVSGLDPATLESDLADIGFRLIEDLGPPQIQVRFLAGVTGFNASEHCHLVQVLIDRS